MTNINELTAVEAIKGLKEGKFKSVDLVNACLSRIEVLNEDVKAYITICEENALESASQADKAISKEGLPAFEKAPLLGIPFAAKDNFCTHGIRTTAGSKVLDEFVPPYESTVTARLKEAGAILLGKTNMDAFAHGSSTEESDFFITSNPWDTERVPGGSSGGSAAAVAADMCLFAIGSETGGSIRGPSSWCGITGFKPTYGRVSRYGVVAMASSTDSPGPITKSAEDALLVINVISGKDPLDATSVPLKPQDLERSEKPSFQGIRIGIPSSYFEIDLDPEVKKITLDFILELEEKEASKVEVDLLDPKHSIAVYTILQRSEVSSNLARFDGIRYGNDRSAFGFEAKKRMMLGAYALSSGYYEAYYSKAQKVRTQIVDDFNKVFNQVDLIVAPTMPCTALKKGESRNNPMFGELMDVLTEPSTIAGLCGITLPAGFSQGLPVGVQLIGDRFDDISLLELAHEYQTGTKHHQERPYL